MAGKEVRTAKLRWMLSRLIEERVKCPDTTVHIMDWKGSGGKSRTVSIDAYIAELTFDHLDLISPMLEYLEPSFPGTIDTLRGQAISQAVEAMKKAEVAGGQ